MSVEWTGLPPEVIVSLDRGRADSLSAQFQEAIREAVRKGRLAPGERLPSSRALASQLGVSRGLVTACYEQLAAEGYLTARAGSPTRVAADAVAAPHPPPEHPVPTEPAIDFLAGLPCLASFPTRDWLWALTAATTALPTSFSGYGDPRGRLELREVVAAYLRRVRAATVSADNLVICGGYTQGVGLVFAALAARGVTDVAVEDPGHTQTPLLAARAGLRAVPVTVDADGLVVAELADSRARAVVLTPAHQSPTGGVLGADRRRALVAWAREHDGYLVEDDYDAEFRYDRQPVGSLQGLAPDRVFHIGSVSKPLGPAVRLGWIATPNSFTDAVAHEKLLNDHGSPALDQHALAELIRSGRYDRHLRRMRGLYAERRSALVASLTEHAPRVRLTGLSAGFHATAHLPGGLTEHEVVAHARQRDVGLHPMGDYRLRQGHHRPQLVVGFGNLRPETIRHGIRRVADILDT
jgi:GntR family transcriptional regulator / MocR family aminotransferase